VTTQHRHGPAGRRLRRHMRRECRKRPDRLVRCRAIRAPGHVEPGERDGGPVLMPPASASGSTRWSGSRSRGKNAQTPLTLLTAHSTGLASGPMPSLLCSCWCWPPPGDVGNAGAERLKAASSRALAHQSNWTSLDSPSKPQLDAAVPQFLLKTTRRPRWRCAARAVLKEVVQSVPDKRSPATTLNRWG
jgi:hypothetical protein